MKFTSLALAFLPVVLGGVVAPRQAAFDFTVCDDPNWSGFCIHYGVDIPIVERQCYSLVKDWKDKGSISSVRTAAGTRCVMYPNEVCDPGNHSDSDELYVSGSYWDLGYVEIAWDGRPKSFWCERI